MDYKEKLRLAKEALDSGSYDKETIEYIFPELKESEDERIKGNIIATIHLYYGEPLEDEAKEMIAWLEKQGESYTKRDVDDAYLKGVTNTKNEIEKQYEANYQIRKDIATFIFNYKGDIKDRAKWMNYLGIKVSFVEKQGEQKSTDKVEPKFNIGDIIFNKKTKEQFTITGRSLSLQYYHDEDHLHEVRFTEQDDWEIIKPKFHEGDWVVSPNGVYWHIDRIENNRYKITSDTGKCADWPLDTNIYHKFNIQDAKDGDVLFQDLMGGKTFIFDGVNPDMAILYSFIISNDGKDVLPYHIGKPNTGIGNIEENKNIIRPATKEQRDILFQKMHKAGYEWDADKKELKKIVTPIFNIGDTIIKKHNSDINGFGSFTITDITGGKYWYNDRIICGITEQNEWEIYEPVRQKPAWSEEDEKEVAVLEAYIRSKDWSESHIDRALGIVDELVNKVKSFRPQTRWKPSDEQMDAVKSAALDVAKFSSRSEQLRLENEPYYKALVSLYNDLEELMEE